MNASATGLLCCAMTVLIAGCSAGDPDRSALPPAPPALQGQAQPWRGAQHSPQTLDSLPSLVSDHRAYGIGHSVTVLIFEQASSVTSADTRSEKSLDLSGRLEKTDTLDFAALGLENASSGQGSISREGRLMASVSATVTDILPSGELQIRGEQIIEFNNETQHIRVSGRIRPNDINANNTVLSTRIAQAEIVYVGDGLLGSRQQPGVITRFFNWLF